MRYVFLIFCVSYAVSPAKIKTPRMEIANITAGDPRKMLTMDAIRMPITPMIRKEPHPEMSFFVVYPHRDRPAKAIAVTRNV